MQTEAALQRAIIHALEQAGAYVVNVVVAGRSGTPDLVACYRSRFIALEVKLPKRKATPKQEVELRLVERAGGVALVVRSVEEALAALP